ncbi:Uncharacterised protein [uncultured archaeon]|nr:Uncharacterised protein [uncultured archaeon]
MFKRKDPQYEKVKQMFRAVDTMARFAEISQGKEREESFWAYYRSDVSLCAFYMNFELNGFRKQYLKLGQPSYSGGAESCELERIRALSREIYERYAFVGSLLLAEDSVKTSKISAFFRRVCENFFFAAMVSTAGALYNHASAIYPVVLLAVAAPAKLASLFFSWLSMDSAQGIGTFSEIVKIKDAALHQINAYAMEFYQSAKGKKAVPE